MTAATVTPIIAPRAVTQLVRLFAEGERGEAVHAMVGLARAGGLLTGGTRMSDLPDEVIDRLAGDVRLVVDAFAGRTAEPAPTVVVDTARVDALIDELLDVMADRTRLRDQLNRERATAARKIAQLTRLIERQGL